MLQQTQVSRVIPYFERFIEKYPTVQRLAQSTWEEFLPYYQGLGYYARGRNMLKTAQKVVGEFGGEFPTTLEELRTLPGVGPYTAAAILSFGLNFPHLAFDTNQQRVWGRILHGTKTEAVLPAEIESALPSETPYQHLNAGVMDFANAICTNRSPKCDVCPIRQFCVYAQTNGTLEPTTSPRKSTFPGKEAQTIVVLHERHKLYFSAKTDSYAPFLLPSPLNTRARIKEYFLRHFALNIAVRPGHWKGFVDGLPIQVVNAQILAGTHSFAGFAPDDHASWLAQFAASAQSAQE
jgi:A/G-specific adenine glycosylase